MSNIVTVHRFSKTEKPISVNNVAWGVARFSHGKFWAIYSNASPNQITAMVDSVRLIEFAVLDAIKAGA